MIEARAMAETTAMAPSSASDMVSSVPTVTGYRTQLLAALILSE
jgi:hypothetical protein